MAARSIIGRGVSGRVVALDEYTCSKSAGYSDNEFMENQNKRDHAIERRIYERLGHHPRICRYIGFQERTVIMQRYPECLRKRLLDYQKSGIRTNPKDAWKWSLHVSEGLAYIHSKNVLQADISSGNILLDEDGSAVLCDFAGSSIDSEIPWVAHGVRYQRTWPGRKGSQVLDLQDEIFALGCLIYEIWTTKQPYQDEDEKVVEKRYKEDQYPDLESLPPSHVILKCWTGSYVSVQEVVDELRYLIEKDHASLPPVQPRQEYLSVGLRFVREHTAIILLSSAILAYSISRSSRR